ncbi:dynein axonemal heavy chain 11-like [Uloborus diversus]|uniref:dynein axonemal heavy chain 11-like n=1 Tax=Uloborus diversus TaxID=327109 RepID=UPI0024090875|nr:dynein axonemal heavy chain 11-like [Uloborus diversus]
MSAEEPHHVPTTIKDPRLDYLGGLAQIILRVSEEKWLKLLQSEDNRTLLTTNFLDNPEAEAIFVTELTGGSLALYTSSANLPFLPAKHQKAVFFVKTPGVAATAENIRDVITCGDLSSSTVEQLQAFIDYAVIPTLCNPSCHEGWSRELASDLLSKVRAFRSVVARGVAQSKGHVIISVPPIQPFESSAFAHGNNTGSLEDAKESWLRETVSILESSVRHWSEQIQESQQFLDGATMFRGELDDSEQRLDLVLDVMDYLRRLRIENGTVILLEKEDRLEQFVQRLRYIKEFDKDMEHFRKKIEDLDNRLGSIIKGCVLSCTSVEAMSKVLQVCEFLLLRPAIRSVALGTCEKHVMDKARTEMDHLLSVFHSECSYDLATHLPVYHSLPVTSRIIQWVTDINQLLNNTLRSVDNVSHMFIGTKAIQALERKHKKLSAQFSKLSDEVYKKWAAEIPQLLKEKLHQPLIIRSDDKCKIFMNFDSKLDIMIREVKHLMRLKGDAHLPSEAVAFYEKREELGDQKIKLRDIVNGYNDLRHDLLPVEIPLISPTLKSMDVLLEPGETTVIWSETDSSEAWSSYVSFVDELVKEGLVSLIRRNLRFFLQSTMPNAKQVFMIRVHVDRKQGLRFNPNVEKDAEDSFQKLLDFMMSRLFSLGSLVQRVDIRHSCDNYQADMDGLQELRVMQEEFKTRLESSLRDTEEILLDLQPYSYLWKDEADSLVKNVMTLPENTLENLPQITEQVRNCSNLENQIKEGISSHRLIRNWLHVDQSKFIESLFVFVDEWRKRFKQLIIEAVTNTLQDLDTFCTETETELSETTSIVSSSEQLDSSSLLRIITLIQAVQDRKVTTDAIFKPLGTAVKFLRTECNERLDDHVQELLMVLPERWEHTKKLSETWRMQISTPMAKEGSSVRQQVAAFSSKQIHFREQFRLSPAFQRDCPAPAIDMLRKLEKDIKLLNDEVQALRKSGKLFEVHVPEFSQLKQCESEILLLHELWSYIEKVKIQLGKWDASPWTKVDLDALEMQCKAYMRDIKSMDKGMRSWDNFIWLQDTIKNILVALRAIHQLRNPAIKERHWTQLSAATQVPLSVTEETPLRELLSLELHRFEDVVEGMVERASKELATERILADLEATWAEITFERSTHSRTGHHLLHISDALIATLEDNQVQLQNLMSSKHVAHFFDHITEWVRKLTRVESVIMAWVDVQRAWSQMESIFMGSEDIKDQLPEDCERFMSIDASFKTLVNVLSAESETVVTVSDKLEVHDDLSHLQTELALCEKALASYLETKRRIFPRFYFVSSADLLDILSNGTQPSIVVRHLPKLFDSVAKLRFDGESDVATGIISRDGESLDLKDPCHCTGPVENWLNALLSAIRYTLKEYLSVALGTYEDGHREQWIFENAAQVALTGTQIWWAAEVSAALQRVRQGHETALKQYNKKQMLQLHHLIGLLLTDLSRDARQKVMTICTMDVHARDVVSRLVSLRVESELDFAWQSQLRHRWDDEDCVVHICDARFDFCHEYLGNTPRLVVTPLTDRCFITITQSLKLMMGGAPTGPAGTGKTETVKDLGRALGTLVYVFNCSEQMDYRSCANIYKGLAQTGAWGCFDEFNRISVEVLSVVAVQVKCVQDALRANKPSLCLLGDDVPLKKTLGIFITMNPGYAGRTELPENLKTLFRPCAMVAPDSQLICEIMLVAEGFVEARSLGQKFTTLYSLCKQLLSQQDHYDWGLRAIKSVLVVAGSLKRSSPATPEEHILMLALRDFNLPKIISGDVGVFMGLIGDLFPALDVPRRKNPVLEKSVREAVTELKLQPEDNFVLKVLQLSDLLEVRHSVFIIGAAGSGKSSVCKTLLTVHRQRGEKPLAFDLNPKAVTNDELFGTINPATREWKDGLLSSLIRDLVNASTEGPRWMILDGDIDPMWIESLNSVMDDNRVLTLASRERISLTSHMRLIFEVSTLERATPATVSRGGVLYLDSADVGWNPFVVSWIERRSVQSEKANLIIFFDKYVPPCLDAVNKRFKTILQLPDICYVQTLCSLLECMLTPENTPPDSPNELYELYFVFCCVCAFGSVIELSTGTDGRVEFSNWFLGEFKSVKFPITASTTPPAPGAEIPTVFDYYIDNKRFYPWTRKLQKFQPSTDISLLNTLVPTKETQRIMHLMELLIGEGHPVMLVGPAGSGKTSVVKSCLDSLDQDSTYQVVNVPFNFYTSSTTVQRAMELHLEKKVGKNYGPPGQKRMIYFIDDFNIPEVDMYGTCQPHTIIRQHLDYGHWYDRNKLTLKEVNNCQYVVCMCPTAGSYFINQRLQRHFCVLSVPPTTADSMQTIFGLQLKEHLRRIQPAGEGQDEAEEFKTSVQQQIIRLSIDLHKKIVSTFHPTATKFHYLFNLRDVSNVFKGLMLSNTESLVKSEDLLQLWLHESQRVYRDKLIDQDDLEKFDKTLAGVLKKNTEMEEQAVQAMMNNISIHCHFAQGIGTSCYQPVSDSTQLVRLIQDALDAYNDINPPMDLVLFQDAVHHVCRITRILESGGNALLIGVGGSGRQSLASLAAYICNLHLHQPTLHSDYDVQDFKSDIASLYLRAGVKNIGSLFMISDAQVADERFLVLVNDLLSSGDIPDLFPEAEVENIISAIRSEVKSAGIFDSRDNCWNFFINKVKRRLKVVLCFSPAGSTLRTRSRKFPTLISCTCIDWFHPWPKEALVTVCNKFLEELPILQPELRPSIADFVAYTYRSVNEVSKAYLRKERRRNETTPKSFLQHIKTYTLLLKKRHDFLWGNIRRFENGLQRLVDTSHQVDVLKTHLAEQEVELTQRSADIDILLKTVSEEAEVVSRERNVAAAEEAKVTRIHEEVSKRQKDCEEDLAAAEPALIAAQEALNTLNKSNLTELRSFGSPPVAVRNVTSAVMVLLATDGKIPKDLSWRAAKLTMSKVDNFLDSLVNFDKNNIHENSLRAVQTYLAGPEFLPEVVIGKSQAAAGLCSWVINVVKYYEVYCNVEPKRKALAEANAEYQGAKEKLARIHEKVTEVESRLNELQAKCDAASEAKTRCESETKRTEFSIHLANRLLGGLASERHRWFDQAADFKTLEQTLPGDMLIASAFVAYLGPFTKPYRRQLLYEKWLPFLETKVSPVPNIENLKAITSLLLEDETIVGRWRNADLPGDKASVENAAIFTSCFLLWRWPLVVDPQVQAIPWIKGMYGEKLLIVRTSQKGYLDVIEEALVAGQTVLIENLEENIDPLLFPLIFCNFVKRGKAIKLGNKEIPFHQDFQLVLHTKLSNPRYGPEIQAQTTIINFGVTPEGLADQLLAEVVSKERPDLEDSKLKLSKQQNEFAITLKSLEDSLLSRLSDAKGNLVGDETLVESLESTKRIAAEVQIKAAEAKTTEEAINSAREVYRDVADRASLVYFVVQDLSTLSPMYLFSLKAIKEVFHKAIIKCPHTDEVESRVQLLVDAVTLAIFTYVSQGLFENDKTVLAAHLTFQILQLKNQIPPEAAEFLLHQTLEDSSMETPVEIMNAQAWSAIRVLASLDEFQGLDRDIEAAPKRWKKFIDSEFPEKEPLPQEWKNRSTPYHKLCILRCLRPDRILYGIRDFISETLGPAFVNNRVADLDSILDECNSHTPVLFVLSPGVDPLHDLEYCGGKRGFGTDLGNFQNVSLGQGQHSIAEQTMDEAAQKGHWVVLQNIHLAKAWLNRLEKKLEELNSSTVHQEFRLFLSANPPDLEDEGSIIPPGLLEFCRKITNEPPKGMQANLHKALDNFSQETLDSSTRETEFKSLLFILSYFHAVLIERKKFGSQGWNYPYPFSDSDLLISANVLHNHLDRDGGRGASIPWDDLRFLFGEIMYGGHITDDKDRKVCEAYLNRYFNAEQMEADCLLCPGFGMPPILDYSSYHDYVDDNLPGESPAMYGLHPNAEIGCLTDASNALLRSLHLLEPSTVEVGGENLLINPIEMSVAAAPNEEKIRQVSEDILEKLPQEFSMAELYGKVSEEASVVPFTAVGLQECERMNALLQEVRTSLKDVERGLKGELPWSEEMDALGDSLASDAVPHSWSAKAYPSLFLLGSWFSDLLHRYRALDRWLQADFALPPTVWLGGLFSPQSFLTAVIQTSGRKHDLPLDKLSIHCDVTKKSPEEFQLVPREGANICGLYMEGGRWDFASGCIVDPILKDLHPPMPVICLKSVLSDKVDVRNSYNCPVYRTRQRGLTFVWEFPLRTNESSDKWVIAGTALVLQI